MGLITGRLFDVNVGYSDGEESIGRDLVVRFFVVVAKGLSGMM